MIFAFPSARGRRKELNGIFIWERRKKENPLEAVMLQGVMAESKGFEPSERLWRSHDFQLIWRLVRPYVSRNLEHGITSAQIIV